MLKDFKKAKETFNINKIKINLEPDSELKKLDKLKREFLDIRRRYQRYI